MITITSYNNLDSCWHMSLAQDLGRPIAIVKTARQWVSYICGVIMT